MISRKRLLWILVGFLVLWTAIGGTVADWALPLFQSTTTREYCTISVTETGCCPDRVAINTKYHLVYGFLKFPSSFISALGNEFSGLTCACKEKRKTVTVRSDQCALTSSPGFKIKDLRCDPNEDTVMLDLVNTGRVVFPIDKVDISVFRQNGELLGQRIMNWTRFDFVRPDGSDTITVQMTSDIRPDTRYDVILKFGSTKIGPINCVAES